VTASKHPLKEVQKKRTPTCIGVTILCSSLYVEFLPGERSSLPCKQSEVHQAVQAKTNTILFGTWHVLYWVVLYDRCSQARETP
jgi:hypothetical protein